MAKLYDLKEDVKAVVNDFDSTDKEFKRAWDDFETKHAQELEKLNRLRDARNLALDVVSRILREEADLLKEDIQAGAFFAKRRHTLLYNQNMTLAKLEKAGLIKQAEENGAIERSIKIDYKAMAGFLEDKGVYKAFEECEDEVWLTTAITGPKPIAEFGGELKKR